MTVQADGDDAKHVGNNKSKIADIILCEREEGRVR